MNNLSDSLKTMAIYAVCLPLAIFLGYIISNPLDMSTVVTYAVIASALCLPILMKWHRPILMLTWNMTAVVFFLPGNPTLGMVAMFFSACVFALQRTLDRNMRFINVPQVTVPLVLLACVVLVTAKLTGGIGFKSLGSETYGGKHYMFLLFGIMAYFVISARPIPPEKARRYMGLFCIGSITAIISDFYSIAPGGAKFIFLFFPPSLTSLIGDVELGTTRLGGAAGFATAIFLFMMCRYGIEGIFSKAWRTIVFILGTSVGMLGGHRAFVVMIGLTFMIQFFLEGLHRTRWLVRLGFLMVIVGVLLVPFANKLPFTLQRTLSWVPFLEVDPDAIESGQTTVEWRFKMWTGLARQIPSHLLLGKGYALTAEEFQGTTGTAWRYADIDPSQNGLALAGDYHNGWLSVILPFGIWGSIAVLWFLGAGGWVLVRNYRYGNPELKLYNTFLLAYFLETVLMFWGGSLHSEMLNFGALIGLSVSLNGGVSKVAVRTTLQPTPVDGRRHLLPRPAFGRTF